MTALGDENICRLDVAVDDAFRVGGIERLGDLDGQRNQLFGIDWTAPDAVLQRHTVEKLHGNECPAIVLADVVDRADIGMI